MYTQVTVHSGNGTIKKLYAQDTSQCCRACFQVRESYLQQLFIILQFVSLIQPSLIANIAHTHTETQMSLFHINSLFFANAVTSISLSTKQNNYVVHL